MRITCSIMLIILSKNYRLNVLRLHVRYKGIGSFNLKLISMLKY